MVHCLGSTLWPQFPALEGKIRESRQRRMAEFPGGIGLGLKGLSYKMDFALEDMHGQL